MRSLPYPGYSWSFTQHAIGIEAKTLYGILGCAALYEGEEGDFSGRITAAMINMDLLTANVRNGVTDAWRDYQQILAELGLIYSTKISRRLRLTDAGHMYLAGEIGYSDLMGIQALRYQYPNGQKSTIQSKLSQILASSRTSQPPTLLELQTNHGILVKPGALLLRILIELHDAGETATLSLDECLAFVLPCKKNSEWPLAYTEILNNRERRKNISAINLHGRRNMQDWFTFLSKSELFVRQKAALMLSFDAISILDNVKSALFAEEALTSFWIPTNYDIPARLKWFDWFGQIGYSVQKIASHPLDDVFVAKNFIGGLDDDEDASTSELKTKVEIDLGILDINSLLRPRDFSPITDVNQEMLDRINLGAFRRHSKTLLHDRIVASLAKKLEATGAILNDDRNSVDLHASWSNHHEAIFEIKTVTMRSFPGRLRMAVGQIEEYAYRRNTAVEHYPEKVIVVNMAIPSTAWQVDFLRNRMGIGLLCTPSEDVFEGFAPINSRTARHWT